MNAHVSDAVTVKDATRLSDAGASQGDNLGPYRLAQIASVAGGGPSGVPAGFPAEHRVVNLKQFEEQAASLRERTAGERTTTQHYYGRTAVDKSEFHQDLKQARQEKGKLVEAVGPDNVNKKELFKEVRADREVGLVDRDRATNLRDQYRQDKKNLRDLQAPVEVSLQGRPGFQNGLSQIGKTGSDVMSPTTGQALTKIAPVALNELREHKGDSPAQSTNSFLATAAILDAAARGVLLNKQAGPEALHHHHDEHRANDFAALQRAAEQEQHQDVRNNLNNIANSGIERAKVAKATDSPEREHHSRRVRIENVDDTQQDIAGRANTKGQHTVQDRSTKESHRGTDKHDHSSEGRREAIAHGREAGLRHDGFVERRLDRHQIVHALGLGNQRFTVDYGAHKIGPTTEVSPLNKSAMVDRDIQKQNMDATASSLADRSLKQNTIAASRETESLTDAQIEQEIEKEKKKARKWHSERNGSENDNHRSALVPGTPASEVAAPASSSASKANGASELLPSDSANPRIESGRIKIDVAKIKAQKELTELSRLIESKGMDLPIDDPSNTARFEKALQAAIDADPRNGASRLRDQISQLLEKKCQLTIEQAPRWADALMAAIVAGNNMVSHSVPKTPRKSDPAAAAAAT